jgi:hypothetical protein
MILKTLWILIFLIKFKVALVVDARIDFNSSYTFPKGLIKVQSTTISGQEYILVLFNDSTISKFNTDMV